MNPIQEKMFSDFWNFLEFLGNCIVGFVHKRCQFGILILL